LSYLTSGRVVLFSTTGLCFVMGKQRTNFNMPMVNPCPVGK
jgi:hypothetical protein